ncbi:MAG: polyphosphate kinase 1 [Chloroflexi bacterium]|nr:polyphosphate kinase 1 [Chloroflexota bacterium]MCY4247634.1 polyphosphate kinase 1 [Chloroflexota bacterium]
MSEVEAGGLPLLTPDNFINRELSTIDFQKRVLALAEDESTPLLERVKFIAIVGNNLDEFFMVRVGAYFQKLQLRNPRTRPDGMTPMQLLQLIHTEVSALIARQRRLRREVFTLLEREGIRFINTDQLDQSERDAISDYFRAEVFPLLTPLAVDHARPFPFISNLSLNLGVYLQRKNGDMNSGIDFARVKVPLDALPRIVRLENVLRAYTGNLRAGCRFLWMEDIIADYLSDLFPGMQIHEAFPFRIIRNADIDYEYEWEEDLLDVKSIIEQGVRERRFGSVVRLGVPETISQRMVDRLASSLELPTTQEVFRIDGKLGSADLFELLQVERADLKDPPHSPRLPQPFAQSDDFFGVIRQQDVIVHLPYDSFAPVEDFFKRAARDPNVLAIKTTLYRVGKNSPVVNALMEARDNEKQVTVLVELKARFDEENNLEWVTALAEKGVHVIYGVEELSVKTHAKISLVVRREREGLRRYVHLGTGNYNAATARLYADIGLFTCNPEVADDASRLFNRLTGYAPDTRYQRLLVAPEYLRDSLLKLIDNEIAVARGGGDARLIFKMNQLEEDRIIQKLYQASQAGVTIDLIVRGLCCLRPGLPGLSDNITVKSIVGRYLEHSRIYYFRNAPPEQRLYMGSADLMRRNLLNRVEVVFPILDPRIQWRALRILQTDLRDIKNSWSLRSDGAYQRLWQPGDQTAFDSHVAFMQDSFGLCETPD